MQPCLPSDLPFGLLAGGQAVPAVAFGPVQVYPDLQKILEGNVQSPGSACLPVPPGPLLFGFVIEHGPCVGIGVPLFRLLFQEIDCLPLVSRLAPEMLHGYPDQVKVPHREITGPEFSRQLSHCLLPRDLAFHLPRCLPQELYPPIEPCQLLHQVFRAESRLSGKVSAVGIRQRPEISLEPGEPGIVADDGKPLQVVRHVGGHPGQPGAQKLLQEALHLPGRVPHFLQVVNRRVRRLRPEGLSGQYASLHLAPEDGGGLVPAQLLFMAGAGGIFQRGQELHCHPLFRQVDSDHRGLLYHRADAACGLVDESLEIAAAQGLLELIEGVGVYLFPCGAVSVFIDYVYVVIWVLISGTAPPRHDAGIRNGLRFLGGFL